MEISCEICDAYQTPSCDNCFDGSRFVPSASAFEDMRTHLDDALDEIDRLRGLLDDMGVEA